MRRAVALTAGVAAGLTLLLAGCGGGDAGDEAEGDDSSVFQMQVGTCFNDQGDIADVQQIGSVPVVDCDEPHDNEVFALVDLPDGDFPADVAEQAQQICDGEVFTEYLGIPMLESEYSSMTIYPTAQSWSDGDREVVCGLFRDDLEKMTGLQRGTGATTS